MEALSIFDQSLPPHCTPTTPFLTNLSTYFHSCVPTPLAFISTLLGSLSIISWLFAQMPQIYKNYQLKSTAGLSIFFLTEWLLGDATNLVGALLTKQASWQIVVASYYVFVDLCLVIQYFWYTHYVHWKYEGSLHSAGSSEFGDADSDIINGLSPINTNFHEDEATGTVEDVQITQRQSNPIDTPHFNQVNFEKGKENSAAVLFNDKGVGNWLATPSPRTLMYAATLASMANPANANPIPISLQSTLHISSARNPMEVAGTIISWCSTLLYLGSRLPQLYKNWSRQSTAGLSPLLFFAAFCGNFFYSTSMITNPSAWNDFEPYGGYGWADGDGSRRWEWVARAAPFFLGAAGVLGLDAMMGVQFLMYGEREEKIVKVRDSYGHTRWQRVDGWMRGWIPTIAGRERTVDPSESQRLIRETQDLSMSRSRYGEYGTL